MRGMADFFPYPDHRQGGDIAQGKALDLAEAAPLAGFDSVLTGTNTYEETTDSEVVVITAGLPRIIEARGGGVAADHRPDHGRQFAALDGIQDGLEI